MIRLDKRCGVRIREGSWGMGSWYSNLPTLQYGKIGDMAIIKPPYLKNSA